MSFLIHPAAVYGITGFASALESAAFTPEPKPTNSPNSSKIAQIVFFILSIRGSAKLLREFANFYRPGLHPFGALDAMFHRNRC